MLIDRGKAAAWPLGQQQACHGWGRPGTACLAKPQESGWAAPCRAAWRSMAGPARGTAAAAPCPGPARCRRSRSGRSLPAPVCTRGPAGSAHGRVCSSRLRAAHARRAQDRTSWKQMREPCSRYCTATVTSSQGSCGSAAASAASTAATTSGSSSSELASQAAGASRRELRVCIGWAGRQALGEAAAPWARHCAAPAGHAVRLLLQLCRCSGLRSAPWPGVPWLHNTAAKLGLPGG